MQNLKNVRRAASFRAIERAWLDHVVLRFRGQHLTDAQLIAFSRWFGELDQARLDDYAPFVPEHPDPSATDVQDARTLAVDDSGSSARHVAAVSHGCLLALERTLNDSGVLRTQIAADDARKTVSFLGLTAATSASRTPVCSSDAEASSPTPRAPTRTRTASADAIRLAPPLASVSVHSRGTERGRHR